MVKRLFQAVFSAFLLNTVALAGIEETPVLQTPPINSKRDQKTEMLLEIKAKKRLIQTSKSVSSTEISSKQVTKLPQGMEISLPKLMAITTPGIVPGPFGQTFIRGNHASIQYQIDGVQLPDSTSNTFGQTLSPRNIERMEIITGGIPAEYGQRLSAVVNIVTKTGGEVPQGELELNYGSYNTVTPHLLYGGSNDSGTFHYFFSANYNRTDRGLDTPQPESLENQSQGGKDSVHNQSAGNSQFAKAEWLADNENKLIFILFNSQNDFQIPNFPPSFGPAFGLFQPGVRDQFGNDKGPLSPVVNYVPHDTDVLQSERNAYGQAVWKHTFPSNQSFLQVAPYYKYSLIRVDNDPEKELFARRLNLGATTNSFAQNRHVNNLGLKVDYTLRAGANHLFKTGAQIQASRSDGTISIQTDLKTAPLVDSSPNVGYFQSAYFQDDFTLSQSLILNIGLRWDTTQFDLGGLSSTDSFLQPRVGLNYLMSEDTKLHFFYGKLFQPAPVENLRYRPDPATGSFVSLEAYDIKAEKDDFYEAGLSHQFGESHVASFNAYYKDGIHILDDYQILNTPIAQPYNFAQGFAYGAEVSLRGRLNEDWSDYLNYSYGIAKGKGISGGAPDEEPSADYQFLDHVQLHTATAGLTYSKNYFWWTTQGLFGSGLRTGPNNSLSLPSHFTLDATIGYEFHGKTEWSQLKLSADVLNIFDNRYPITIANGFNGSHYAAGRMFFVRMSKAF